MNLHQITDKLSDAAQALAGWRPDGLLIAGAGGVAYGAWLIYEPAGFIAGGLLVLLAGVIDSRSAG